MEVAKASMEEVEASMEDLSGCRFCGSSGSFHGRSGSVHGRSGSSESFCMEAVEGFMDKITWKLSWRYYDGSFHGSSRCGSFSIYLHVKTQQQCFQIGYLELFTLSSIHPATLKRRAAKYIKSLFVVLFFFNNTYMLSQRNSLQLRVVDDVQFSPPPAARLCSFFGMQAERRSARSVWLPAQTASGIARTRLFSVVLLSRKV